MSVFMRLFIMKMNIKMRNRSHRYDINSPGSRLNKNIINIKSVSV